MLLIGATEDSTKELLAVVDGSRVSTQSWRELLAQLKRSGLSAAPKLAIGDGSLGFFRSAGDMARRPAALLVHRPSISWIMPRVFRQASTDP